MTKILDWSKLKAFADNKSNVAKIFISVFDSLENIAEKGENAGYQHFLLFPQCFQKVYLSGSLKVEIVSYRVKPTVYHGQFDHHYHSLRFFALAMWNEVMWSAANGLIHTRTYLKCSIDF